MPKTTARTILSLALSAVALASGTARAEGAQEEWRVLGPAFAHHFTSDGEVVKPASKKQECGTADDGLGNTFTSPTPVPGALLASPPPPGGPYTYYRLQAYTCKDVAVPAERKGWESSNPALGLEYTRRYDTHSDKVLATLARDSYGKSSFMLAAGRLWPVLNLVGVQFDAGVVGGLWNRTILNQAGDDVVRRTVPFVLPALSISEERTGLGLNLALAPKMSINSYAINRTTTLMVQSTWLVRKTMTASSGVSLDVKADGTLQASYSSTF